MQLDITGQHIEITEALKSYVENKFKRLKRHSDEVNHIHVILSVEKQRHKAEGCVDVDHGKLFAHDEKQNMYASIDSLVDKLDRQLKKQKERATDHRS